MAQLYYTRFGEPFHSFGTTKKNPQGLKKQTIMAGICILPHLANCQETQNGRKKTHSERDLKLKMLYLHPSRQIYIFYTKIASEVSEP